MSGTPAVPRPVGDAPRRWIAVVRLLPSDLRTDRGFLQHIASGKDEEAFAWLTSKVDEAAQRVASLRRTYAKLDALVRRLDRIDRDWFVPHLGDDEQRLYSPWRVRSARERVREAGLSDTDLRQAAWYQGELEEHLERERRIAKAIRHAHLVFDAPTGSEEE